jgi:hypothetical protein
VGCRCPARPPGLSLASDRTSLVRRIGDNIAGGLGLRVKSLGIAADAEEVARLIARLQAAERTVPRPVEPGVPLRGGRDLLPFLAYLERISGHREWFVLSRLAGDSVTVEIANPGYRIDVEFFEDRVEYRVFEGHEDVLDDQERLFAQWIAPAGTRGPSVLGRPDRGSQPLNGLRDLSAFCDFLEERRLVYTVDRQSDKAMLVAVRLAGARLEIDFYEHSVEYGVFFGDDGRRRTFRNSSH